MAFAKTTKPAEPATAAVPAPTTPAAAAPTALALPAQKVIIGIPELDQMTATLTTLVAATVAAGAITTEVSCAKARELMNEAASLTKIIENQRVAAKAPALDYGRQIDALAKKLCTPLDRCVTQMKILLADYAMEIERQRIAADQARLRLEEQAAREAEEEGEGRVPVVVTSEVYVPPPADVRTHSSIDYIFDMDLLPKEYCMPDEKKIKAALAEGKTIPGMTVEKKRTIRTG